MAALDQETADGTAPLIGGPIRIGSKPPVRLQLTALKQPYRDFRVADIEGEQHVSPSGRNVRQLHRSVTQGHVRSLRGAHPERPVIVQAGYNPGKWFSNCPAIEPASRGKELELRWRKSFCSEI